MPHHSPTSARGRTPTPGCKPPAATSPVLPGQAVARLYGHRLRNGSNIPPETLRAITKPVVQRRNPKIIKQATV